MRRVGKALKCLCLLNYLAKRAEGRHDNFKMTGAQRVLCYAVAYHNVFLSKRMWGVKRAVCTGAKAQTFCRINCGARRLRKRHSLPSQFDIHFLDLSVIIC